MKFWRQHLYLPEVKHPVILMETRPFKYKSSISIGDPDH